MTHALGFARRCDARDGASVSARLAEIDLMYHRDTNPYGSTRRMPTHRPGSFHKGGNNTHTLEPGQTENPAILRQIVVDGLN